MNPGDAKNIVRQMSIDLFIRAVVKISVSRSTGLNAQFHLNRLVTRAEAVAE